MALKYKLSLLNTFMMVMKYLLYLQLIKYVSVGNEGYELPTLEET